MENISDLRSTPLPEDLPYGKPFRLCYKQNGLEKSWDLLKVGDDFTVILFNVSRNVLVFIKQFRPAVYYRILNQAGEANNLANIDYVKFPPKQAVTIEMCQGMYEQDKRLVETVQEKIYEEVGYKVDSNRIEQVIQYRNGVGTKGALQTLFYCEVMDDDRTNQGDSVGDDSIEVVEYSLSEARKMVELGAVVNSTPNFLFALLWFLTNKASKSVK